VVTSASDAANQAWQRSAEFGDELGARCAQVREHHDGIIPSAWPRWWQLATAFALRDHRHLAALGASTPDVARAVAEQLDTDPADAALTLHAAISRTGSDTGPATGVGAVATIRLLVQVEVDHGTWVLVAGDDPDHLDSTLSEDIADLVGLMLPASTRLVLSWAEVAVRPAEPTRVPCSPAHNIGAVLVEVTVAEALWRETGPAGADLAEDVRAGIAAALAAISQFVDTDAAIVTEIVLDPTPKAR
jgi:hypothetical protein